MELNSVSERDFERVVLMHPNIDNLQTYGMLLVHLKRKDS